jgi:hypothetical protein
MTGSPSRLGRRSFSRIVPAGGVIEYPTLLSARGKPLQLEDIEIVPGSGAVPFNRQRFGGRTPEVRGEAKASGRPRRK